MDKHKIIPIIALSVIIGILGFSFLNVYGLEKIELSGIKKDFRFYDLSNNDKIKMCNNSFIPVHFNHFKVIFFYENKILGYFIVDAKNILPYSVLDADGKYLSDSRAQSQYLFMHFDHLFSGDDNTIRIDPRNLVVSTEFQTSVIGFPYLITKQSSGLDFWNMLNEKNNPNC